MVRKKKKVKEKVTTKKQHHSWDLDMMGWRTVRSHGPTWATHMDHETPEEEELFAAILTP